MAALNPNDSTPSVTSLMVLCMASQQVFDPLRQPRRVHLANPVADVPHAVEMLVRRPRHQMLSIPRPVRAGNQTARTSAPYPHRNGDDRSGSTTFFLDFDILRREDLDFFTDLSERAVAIHLFGK